MGIITCSLIINGRINEVWPGITHMFSFKFGASDMPHQVIVKLSSLLVDKWELDNNEIKINKVLYASAREAIERNPSEIEQTIILLPSNSPDKCPEKFKNVKFPNPDPFNIEIF